MSIREFLFGTALMSLALVSVAAAPASDTTCAPDVADEVWPRTTGDSKVPHEASATIPVPALPAPMVIKDRIIGSAYYDARSILNTSNPCSDFFGGSAVSLEVFNSFISRLKRDFYSVSIGMRMSGPVTSVLNVRTKTAYRLFDKVSVNANGPFYRSTVSRSEPTLPRIGSFLPNSREIRVLILLHELGHLMKGTEGNWLLPDDGGNVELSRANSQKIATVCGDQIRGLSKSVNARNQAKGEHPEQALASVGPSHEPKQ